MTREKGEKIWDAGIVLDAGKLDFEKNLLTIKEAGC